MYYIGFHFNGFQDLPRFIGLNTLYMKELLLNFPRTIANEDGATRINSLIIREAVRLSYEPSVQRPEQFLTPTIHRNYRFGRDRYLRKTRLRFFEKSLNSFFVDHSVEKNQKLESMIPDPLSKANAFHEIAQLSPRIGTVPKIQLHSFPNCYILKKCHYANNFNKTFLNNFKRCSSFLTFYQFCLKHHYTLRSLV